jgi:hypothetical protein
VCEAVAIQRLFDQLALGEVGPKLRVDLLAENFLRGVTGLAEKSVVGVDKPKVASA